MTDRKLTILYASQTGNAEEVAERIWRESRRFRWSGPVMEMNKFPPNELPSEQYLVFVCSTTGQGDEPDNMKTLWKFLLRRNLPSTSLVAVKFAILGLGDSSYLKFNFVAKKLHKRLLQLGATSILDLGLADDQHDLGAEAVIGPWISLLWKKLEQLHPLPVNQQPGDVNCISTPRYRVKLYKNNTSAHAQCGIPVKDIPIFPRLVQNIRTTSENHFQDVRLLRICAPELKYQPGDVLVVQPENLEENINTFLKLLNLDGSSMIDIKTTEDKYAFSLPPSWLYNVPCTLRDCVRKLLDLQAAPKRYALQILAHFTTSDLEREKLLQFCSPEGEQEFFDYCYRPRRTILEVLHDFPCATAALPVQYLFDVFRPIRPRSFSIASASETCNDHVEVLVAVVKYRTRLQAPRLGLCSNWMARLKPEDEVPCWVHLGSLHFPSSHQVPLIMVGPGTGCAPFRSLVQQRSTYNNVGRLVLFLGFRNEHGDFHCQTEWQHYVDTGLITLFCAFSRDQSQKVYVQHKILEEGQLIWKLLQSENAYFYVAGSSKNMPAAVREAVVKIVQSYQKCTEDEAELYVKNLEKCGRYQTETWS